MEFYIHTILIILVLLQLQGTYIIWKNTSQGKKQTGAEYLWVLIIGAWAYYFQLLVSAYRWLTLPKRDL